MSDTIQKKRHKHTFHGLWWHWGSYGPQDEHIHDCLDDDCDRITVGSGRSCDPQTRHERRWLVQEPPQ